MIHEQYKLDIDSASDGQIAVEMFNESLQKRCKCSLRAYRLIFMDL